MAVVLSIIAALLLALLALQGWALLHLHGQQGRLHARLDGLGRRHVARRRPATDLALRTLDGGATSLARLRAAGKPMLLVFADPRCGPCYELLPDVGGWQRVYGDRLTIALISGGDPAQNRAMTAEYGIQNVVLQRERDVNNRYGVTMAPAAVVIEPDGTPRGEPVYGAPAVRELAAATLGLALPPAPMPAGRAVTVGDRVPTLRRPDLAGNPVDLASAGEPTLVLFWSPGCRPCQELLPEIKAWEAGAGRPRLVVVSRGPAGLNRETGFASSLVLDDDRSLAAIFGVGGTPAAVLIDSRGIVASPVARGASGVRELAARLAPTAAAAD